jgi:hypothetical protein
MWKGDIGPCQTLIEGIGGRTDTQCRQGSNKFLYLLLRALDNFSGNILPLGIFWKVVVCLYWLFVVPPILQNEPPWMFVCENV